MGLALFHTIFNVLGVFIFFPFIGLLARFLFRIFPDHKEVLTVYLNNTPVEVIDAAAAALRKEILHLLAECQLYSLRTCNIDEKLIFAQTLPFEKNRPGETARTLIFMPTSNCCTPRSSRITPGCQRPAGGDGGQGAGADDLCLAQYHELDQEHQGDQG